ncbi:hypothetical protein KR044_003533 [Drosophila immigrans]|nr:hypothetical protein KR044_003533 [Drosophila immigrans]
MLLKRLRNIEDQKKKFELKLRFKKVIRLIIINSIWAEPEFEDERKNLVQPIEDIRFLVRTTQKSELFTASDKSLLRTPHKVRSAAERKKLRTLFTNLKCFRDIPPSLRIRLVPVINLNSINAGRTVLKEGDEPHTVVFIVAGNIEMSSAKKVNYYYFLVIGGEIMFGPGDYIGEVELNEGCDRMNTFVTKSQCELLVLYHDDFDQILSAYMKKLWRDKKRAVRALEYFDFLDDNQILKMCKMVTLKQFKPLDTIYSQDKGTLTNVHFVLSGECVILQCLNMRVTHSKGKKKYVLDDTMDDDINQPNESDLKREEINSIINMELNEDELKEKKKVSSVKQISRSLVLAYHGKMNLEEIEIACGLVKQREKERSIYSHLGYRRKRSNIKTEATNEFDSLDGFEENSGNYSLDEGDDDEISTVTQSTIETHNYQFSFDSETLSESSLKLSTHAFGTSESHFIDVGSVTFAGIFGLGEKSQHRVIMARDVVQCLLIPRFYLMDTELNPGNVWQRRLFYLNCMIPTREMLFNQYIQNLEWKKFKSNYIEDQVKNLETNVAAIDDIPILCRIEEGIA